MRRSSPEILMLEMKKGYNQRLESSETITTRELNYRSLYTIM